MLLKDVCLGSSYLAILNDLNSKPFKHLFSYDFGDNIKIYIDTKFISIDYLGSDFNLCIERPVLRTTHNGPLLGPDYIVHRIVSKDFKLPLKKISVEIMGKIYNIFNRLFQFLKNLALSTHR